MLFLALLLTQNIEIVVFSLAVFRCRTAIILTSFDVDRLPPNSLLATRIGFDRIH